MSSKRRGHFEAGRQAMQAADFHRAIESFEQVIAEEVRNSQAWFGLGVSYLESGYIPQAMGALERTLELDPGHADAHYFLGAALSDCGEIDRAAECFQRALAIEPRHARAEEGLQRATDLAESRRHYRNALKILRAARQPDAAVSRAMGELVRSLALFPESPARAQVNACVTQILAAAPGRHHPDGAAEGYDALRRGDWAAAVAAYQEAARSRAADPTTHHALAVAFSRTGDWANAIRAWQRALELDPDLDFMQLRPPKDAMKDEG